MRPQWANIMKEIPIEACTNLWTVVPLGHQYYFYPIKPALLTLLWTLLTLIQFMPRDGTESEITKKVLQAVTEEGYTKLQTEERPGHNYPEDSHHILFQELG